MCTEDLVSPGEKYVNGLALELVMQDSRVKLYQFYGDIQEDAGYIPTKEQIIFPYAIPSVNHQIAHMVEMNKPSRWTMIDWGMRNHVNVENLSARQFFAALSREVRVRAIELHINGESLGDKRSTKYNIFNNHYWLNETEKFLPFGRFSAITQVYDWVNDLRDRTYNAWNVERICHEWLIRLNHIQHWMETKEVISN